jgi:hypothetical protein
MAYSKLDNVWFPSLGHLQIFAFSSYSLSLLFLLFRSALFRYFFNCVAYRASDDMRRLS